MTNLRLTIAAATIVLAAGMFFPPNSAQVTPGTEPDITELNRLQNVDRRAGRRDLRRHAPGRWRHRRRPAGLRGVRDSSPLNVTLISLSQEYRVL